ncbi:hypothetical protein FZEAL_2544 [Fusarium zealandicum]|uniref:Uncharacterized protein n=1 Tax=Fusarium zealandicum TaxID=1053134 RepID=A0A8H4UQN3_9HYPO|nr:hypothetical protein FZEAL_2544 [Fusarium zealandicum]
MHFTTLITTIAALASTAAALPAENDPRAAKSAEVKIMTYNKPMDGKHSKTPISVPLGKLTTVPNVQITEMSVAGIVSNVPGIKTPDLQEISCQRFNDEYGLQRGSARFALFNNALVSTNSVSLGWILCYVNPTPSGV